MEMCIWVLNVSIRFYILADLGKHGLLLQKKVARNAISVASN